MAPNLTAGLFVEEKIQSEATDGNPDYREIHKALQVNNVESRSVLDNKARWQQQIAALGLTVVGFGCLSITVLTNEVFHWVPPALINLFVNK